MLLPRPRAVAAVAAGLAAACSGLSAQEGEPDIATLLAERDFERVLPLVQEREREWNTAVRRNDDVEHRLSWAQSLSLLGFVEDHLNMTEPALQHLRLARDLVVEADAGPSVLAATLEKLGCAEGHADFYNAAEQSLLAAIDQHHKVPALEREPWLSITRDHLALLYLEMARYDEAGRILRETLAASGDDGRFLAQRHGYLGKYYHAMRNYGAACEHYERALEFAVEEWGEDHANVIFLTGDLGLAWLRLGADGDGEALDQARLMLTRAAELARRLPPTRENNLEFASFLSNLGQLALTEAKLAETSEIEHERLSEARMIFLEALETLAPRVGPSSPLLAPFYNNLGYACEALGSHDEARNAYREAATRYRDSFGADHQRYIEVVTNLALNHLLANGPGEEAKRQVEQTTRSRLAVFERVIGFGSERERLNYLERDNIASLPCTLGHDPALIANVLLRTKDRLLDSLMAAEAEEGELLALLRAKQRQRDELVFREDRERLQDVRDEIIALLVEIERESPRPSDARESSLEWTAVQESLPDHGAFVDFVRYQNYLAAPDGPLHYGAVLILPSGPPRWIPLGSEQDLAAWLSIMKDRLDYRAHLLTSRDPVSPPPFRLRTALRQLHDLFWAPVARELPPDTDSLALSPDGRLNFVSFAVLIDEHNQLLAGRFRNLVYLSNARDLLVEDEPPALAAGPWTVVAVPEFEAGASNADLSSAAALDQFVLDTIRPLPDLPGARRELRLLRRLTPNRAGGIELLNASETQLRALSASPAVLHLTTHAFFLPERDAHIVSGVQDFDRQPEQFYRSGLVLTEAKRALSQRAAGLDIPFDRDGVIFSDELKSLPLHETQLVTLSSCESGLGKSVSGQGVLGLRRGFAVAGTRNILLSLWPVSDRSTPDFMEQVYRLSLATDRIGQSLWEAQRRALRELDPQDDAALEEAVLRYGCFVLSQRGPLEPAGPMPVLRDGLNYYWAILLGLGVVGLAALFLLRPPFRRAQV